MNSVTAAHQAFVASPSPHLTTTGHSPVLSVVLKCYNEETRIAACIESVLRLTTALDAEIIVADALSADRTVDIARSFPVRIVQMARTEDRGCGATAQMGSQFAQGEFLLLVDGDMEVLPEFLPVALAEMERDPKLACVGGRLVEMSGGLEFQERRRRSEKWVKPASAKRLTGSALYRMTAIHEAGYFMNRNLYCGEEFEIGLRLRSRGWRLMFLPIDAVRHYGHETPPMTLLRSRWRSRYADGYGQLLRRSWAQPWFWEVVRSCALSLLVIGWWLALALLIAAATVGLASPLLLLAIFLLPVITVGIRKRSLMRGVYAVLSWQVLAAGLLRGLFRPYRNPADPVTSLELA